MISHCELDDKQRKRTHVREFDHMEVADVDQNEAKATAVREAVAAESGVAQ
jgi:hypothetical protein